MKRFIAALISVLCFADVCEADFASEFQERVKSLFDKFQEIDKRAGLLISQSGSTDFKKYAEIRNEISRFIAEPRQEIVRARSIGDENAAQRLRTEQELKSILPDLDVDVTDDDSKPLPYSALLPRVEASLTSTKLQLEESQKALSELLTSRMSKLQKLKDKDLTDADREILKADLKKTQDDAFTERNSVTSLRTKNDQLKKAKELIARTMEYSSFSLNFGPEIERLASLETRANQRIQQIDEAIFNLLLVESNDKRYTLYSTLVFGVAVVIVIGAFFFVAYKSEAIRASIFANDSGLQFVTLFSLVIAIILFGVLKILEAKELAALLGGLSGYILGRGGISRQPQANQAPAPPVAAPLQNQPPVATS